MGHRKYFANVASRRRGDRPTVQYFGRTLVALTKRARERQDAAPLRCWRCNQCFTEQAFLQHRCPGGDAA